MLRYSKKTVLFVLDFMIINLAYIISLYLRFEAPIPAQYINTYLSTFLMCSTVKLVFYNKFGLYNSLWRYAGIDELIKIFAATTLGSVSCLLLSIIIDRQYPLSVGLIVWMITLLLIGTSRMSYRIIRKIYYYRLSRTGTNRNTLKRVLIVGAGDAGETILRELETKKYKEYLPVALVDDNPGKLHKNIHGILVKGSTSEIKKIAEAEKIDEIIIALPSISKKVLHGIVKSCQTTGCKIKILPGIYEMLDGKVTVNDIREVKIEDLLGREEVNINLNEISKYLIDETVLVTGGGGSIGSELCRQIARFRPRKLIILDIYENNAYELQNELNFMYPMLDLEVIIASVRDYERMRSIFHEYRPSVVFHAAAHKHVPLMENNPSEAIKNNIFGTFNTAMCADEYGTAKFVLISTDKAVNPTNVMGATKRVCEMIIQTLDRRSKTEYVAVRFGNVLGSNGSVIPLFKKQIEHGGPVTVTHKEVTRFFMTIPEAVRLVMQAGAIATGGEIFVLDMGEPVKIDDLARELIRLLGFEPDIDIEIKYTGLRPGEKLYEELLLHEEGLEATKHEGIFVAKPVYIGYGQLMKWLDTLESAIKEPDKIKDVLSQIVPTYNSIGYKPVQGSKDKIIDYAKLEVVNT